MVTFNFEKNLSKGVYKRQQSLNELLKKYYQLGFDTGYKVGFGQCVKELAESACDIVTESTRAPDANTSDAILEAEKMLRKNSQN